MKLLSPTSWSEYELIDCGEFEKLERFGDQIVARPEPQAVWDKSLSGKEWEQLADAHFVVKSGKDKKDESNLRGEWIVKKGKKEQWLIGYNYKKMQLKFNLRLTTFSHIGIFPEQASNWNYIYDSISVLKQPNPRIINLFAYTGGISLAARSAGAEVTHLDSVKGVISWARENMEASNLSNVRWIVDDAVKFVEREVRRGNKYDGIILDPPAYGRGPDGEKWILETGINDLLKSCNQLLSDHGFLLLNLYSIGFSSLIAENLVKDIFGVKNPEIGELYIPDKKDRKLPLGVFVRFIR